VICVTDDVGSPHENAFMRSDITLGATFPDYELPDQSGRRRKLSDIQGGDPMIVVLSRGHFCPKDRRQLRNLVDLYPEIKVAYTKVVTISTDNLLETNEMRDALGAAWPFLSDAGRTVQKDLDIAEYTDPTHDPMIPYTFVLGPGLQIHSSTTATGTGAARRTRTCVAICATLPARSGPTGISGCRACARSGGRAGATTTSGRMGGRCARSWPPARRSNTPSRSRRSTGPRDAHPSRRRGRASAPELAVRVITNQSRPAANLSSE
jgi:peroxiredoxin